MCQTDGQTDGIAMAYTRYSIYAVARKNGIIVNSPLLIILYVMLLYNIHGVYPLHLPLDSNIHVKFIGYNFNALDAIVRSDNDRRISAEDVWLVQPYRRR